ncbi:MAG: archaetidylserine decarboxylase [Pseudomonadota bacterium]|nr:MAG: phosphatidylserine decarboxylase [Pseudomonadota bacterium]
MVDPAFIAILRLLPKNAISRLVGRITRLEGGKTAHQLAIRAFCERYGVAVEEAEMPISEYPTFASFFTRRLRPGARPIASGENVPVSPVDGAVSHAGIAGQGRLVQAKGKEYTLEKLLADPLQAARFSGGAYVTIYLSPRDYHRIHAPLGGKITGYAHVPGTLWPVNRPAVENVPELFARNERLITYLDTPLGRVAVVAVGATCVGRIRALYDDLVTNEKRTGQSHRYETPIPVAKGDEIAVFEMGSTVILLFEPGRIQLDPRLVPGAPVRMGERIGVSSSEEDRT